MVKRKEKKRKKAPPRKNGDLSQKNGNGNDLQIQHLSGRSRSKLSED